MRRRSDAGPVLLDVLTNPEKVAVPDKPTVGRGVGLRLAKVKEIPAGPRRLSGAD
ncbi:hypothetical protein AB0C90_33095 [Streptomyces sp. NPDC048550]|uniref:hypothetical protein n=1 Tax=Streptomyces sp. NPDC048550 TaxID=3155739 RepID=UPI003427A157